MLTPKNALEVAVRIRGFDRLGSLVTIGNRVCRLGNLDVGLAEIMRAWVWAVRWAKDNFLKKVDASLEIADQATGYYAKLVNEWVSSEEWRLAYARGILQGLATVQLKSNDLLTAAKALDAAAVFVGSILRAVIVDGYKFERTANDAFDHKQLQYLCRSDLVFVTDDQPLRTRVSGSSQSPRVISLDELLAVPGFPI